MNVKNLLVICFLAVSCKYTGLTKFDDKSENRALKKIPEGSVVNYQLIHKEIIKPKCLSCHSAPGKDAGGINLESYENVLINIQIIKSEVETNNMPLKKSPSLSKKEKEIFLQWLSIGAPKDVPADRPTEPLPPAPGPTPSPIPTVIPPTPPPVEKLDFKKVNEQVISLRCVGCHSDKSGNKGGINLETYEAVLENIESIKDEVETGSMPKPKTRPLTDVQKKMFLEWIEAGAPNTL